MSRIVVLLLSLLVTVFVIAGCGGEPAQEGTTGETPADTAEQVTETPETPQLSETITLPAGWAINDALTPAEVEAVMGRTGFQTWAETLSDPANGKPQGSFYDGSLAASTVNFLVYCTEGQANYDRVLSFVQNPVEIANTDGANPLWDQAVVGDMPDMADTYKAILVRRGDVCIRIRYNPAIYTGLDHEATLTSLAELIISKIYAQ
jgi:hypothetical protein